jgi:hypothetical protein
MTTFTLLSCVVGLISASKCPDITAFRSDRVQKSFDPVSHSLSRHFTQSSLLLLQKLLDGFWFEHAFIDIAQEGASCQTLNSTFNPTTDKISMAFKVDYAFVPFTIIENYAPKGNVTGYYTKKAQMPGSALLTLPTVVVDVIPSSSGDKYDAMTLYSCIDPLNAVQVHSCCSCVPKHGYI